VNDAFVMDAWGKSANAEHLLMVADGGGEFTKSVGMDMETDSFGGLRSMRYSMLVDDGVVKELNIEDPGRFEVSDADTLFNAI
jgi:peroxiredoxin